MPLLIDAEEERADERTASEIEVVMDELARAGKGIALRRRIVTLGRQPSEEAGDGGRVALGQALGVGP